MMMTNRYRLPFQISFVFAAGVAALGASGCTVTASGSIGIPASGCAADGSVSCATAGTVGYICSADSLPTDADPTLICSDPVVDGTGYDYCCGAAVTGTYGCSVDGTLVCSGGATGESCYGGALPDSSSQICSDPTPNADGSQGYCCAPFTGGNTCIADSTVGGCAYPSYGFSCAAGDNPMNGDATLVCSTPVSAGTQDLFCCTNGTVTTTPTCNPDPTLGCTTPGSSGLACDPGAQPDPSQNCSDAVMAPGGGTDYCCGGTTATGCTADATISCPTAGSTGYDCTPGVDPWTTDPNLSCSSPAITLGNGDDGYCCFDFSGGSSTTCYPDDTLVCTSAGSFGYTCAQGDDPTSYDASLTCSSPVTNADGTLGYCCQ
jgi:hypothetical protein